MINFKSSLNKLRSEMGVSPDLVKYIITVREIEDGLGFARSCAGGGSPAFSMAGLNRASNSLYNYRGYVRAMKILDKYKPLICVLEDRISEANQELKTTIV